MLKPDEMTPNNPCCVIAIHNDFAKEHLELMKQSLRIFNDAATFTMAYPEEAAKSIQNVAGFKYEIATASILPIFANLTGFSKIEKQRSALS